MKDSAISSFSFVQDILQNEEFISLKNFTHHGTTTCYHHTIEVAMLSYRIALYLKLDYVAAARGALLHDFFMYNWRTEGPYLHGFRHPRIAYNNAVKNFKLSKKERDSIIRHMWPLTPTPPRYPESWVVCVADKIISIKDYGRFILAKCSVLQSCAVNKLSKTAGAIAPFLQSER